MAVTPTGCTDLKMHELSPYIQALSYRLLHPLNILGFEIRLSDIKRTFSTILLRSLTMTHHVFSFLEAKRLRFAPFLAFSVLKV